MEELDRWINAQTAWRVGGTPRRDPTAPQRPPVGLGLGSRTATCVLVHLSRRAVLPTSCTALPLGLPGIRSTANPLPQAPCLKVCFWGDTPGHHVLHQVLPQQKGR